MIYLLHFTYPLPRSNGTAATHYLGWCHEGGLDERLEQHRRGWSKVKLIREVLRRGGELVLVHTWPNGGPALEAYLKRNGHLNQFCPLCRRKHLTASRAKQKRWYRASLDRLELPTARQPAISRTTVLTAQARPTGVASTGSPPAAVLASTSSSGGSPGPAEAGGSTAGSAPAKPTGKASTPSAGTGPRCT